MSFTTFQRQLFEIVKDLGASYWKPVADEAGMILRDVTTIRRGGDHLDYSLHWTLAEKQDFVLAAEKLKEAFSEKTGERVMGLANIREAQVSLRPSAIWVDGKTYRVRLAKMWSYSPHQGGDMRWAAEITPFGRIMVTGYRTVLSSERKRFEVDAPSEYLAQKGMRELFEKQFRVTLLA